jgi:glyoxylase-like metal-dependent hydrolase (beta-lactamase superfamily II)
MELAVCSAVISLLFLIVCPPAFAGSQHGVSIKVFTSTDDQFWTNSVMIEGVHEVMLVDAQLTKTNAERVLQEINKTHKPLSIIYITHEHADHFLGLRRNLSRCCDRATRRRRHYIESSHIEVLKHIKGDTDANTMLWIPEQRILIAGDVVFNNMHVYTADTDSKARGKWLSSLKTIRALQPSVVIPGHSKVGAPLDASTAVAFTETYLLAFEEELAKAKDQDSLIKAMKERFPSADLLLAIERGATDNVKP